MVTRVVNFRALKMGTVNSLVSRMYIKNRIVAKRVLKILIPKVLVVWTSHTKENLWTQQILF